MKNNQEIDNVYSVYDILHGTEVEIKYIKVTLRRYKIVVFDFEITKDDWDTLFRFLNNKENKIIGLDFYKSGIDKYFKEFFHFLVQRCWLFNSSITNLTIL